MENILIWLTSHPILSIGTAGFLCGVVLFYHLLMRSIKTRQDADAEV